MAHDVTDLRILTDQAFKFFTWYVGPGVRWGQELFEWGSTLFHNLDGVVDEWG